MKKRLAIITTHPIQYNAPLFALLHSRNIIDVKVFYTWGSSVLENKFDPGFKRNINWDIPLLDGYEHEFVTNVSKRPGSHHFTGINNPDLILKLKQWRPDAILVYGWSFRSHLAILRHFKDNVKVFFRGDSTLLDEHASNTFKTKLRRYFLKWVYSHVDIAFYTGQANKEYFEKHGIKKERLIFAPHAVDNHRFVLNDNFRSRPNAVRSLYDIKEEEILFLFVGKLEPKKDPSLLVEAFGELENDKAHLLFVGEGQLHEYLHRVSHGNPRIHFANFQNQSEIPFYYAAADVFILPSKGPGETWGLAVNEAMASGKAVIVSDKCGCSIDLVEAGINGYIFEATNKSDLKAKMTMLLDKSIIFKMGENSKLKIESWSFQKIAEKLENALG